MLYSFDILGEKIFAFFVFVLLSILLLLLVWEFPKRFVAFWSYSKTAWNPFDVSGSFLVQ
jgi:hypothetical protein